MLLKRDGHVVIGMVADTSSIRSSGLYLTLDPDSLRGDLPLLRDLRGCDRVHLCRTNNYQEEGQHFRSYAVVGPDSSERFQLDAATNGAQRLGWGLFRWFQATAQSAARKVVDLGSESEAEEPKCRAYEVRWETPTGSERLSVSPCTGAGSLSTVLLVEDRVAGDPTVPLCPSHCSQYMQGRNNAKCAILGCYRVGPFDRRKLQFCEEHAPVEEPPHPPTSGTRSRSRARRDAGERATSGSSRRASRLHRDEPHPRALRGGDLREKEDVGDFLKGIRDGYETDREEPVGRRPSRPSKSPGFTPRSGKPGVQRSLAKLGMQASPDRSSLTLLDEFLEQYVEGKDLGLEEQDLRAQMAAQRGKTVEEITEQLYDEGMAEQEDGVKGLTKFLAKWKKGRRPSTGDGAERGELRPARLALAASSWSRPLASMRWRTGRPASGAVGLTPCWTSRRPSSSRPTSLQPW